MKAFSTTIQLKKRSPRIKEIINMLNSIDLSGATIALIDASTFSNSTQVFGKIQLTIGELKTNFSIIAPSVLYISIFASQFNMCSAHHCNICFSLVDKSMLKIDFIPPSNNYASIIESFFEMTSYIPSIN